MLKASSVSKRAARHPHEWLATKPTTFFQLCDLMILFLLGTDFEAEVGWMIIDVLMPIPELTHAPTERTRFSTERSLISSS